MNCMAIEVRQMLIKSNVLQKNTTVEDTKGCGNEALKEEVLEECKQLIIEMLRKEKER